MGFSFLLSVIALVIENILNPIFMFYALIVYYFCDVRLKEWLKEYLLANENLLLIFFRKKIHFLIILLFKAKHTLPPEVNR